MTVFELRATLDELERGWNDRGMRNVLGDFGAQPVLCDHFVDGKFAGVGPARVVIDATLGVLVIAQEASDG